MGTNELFLNVGHGPNYLKEQCKNIRCEKCQNE